MKKIIILVLTALLCGNITAQRTIENANQSWLFRYYDAHQLGKSATSPIYTHRKIPDNDSANWKAVALPHTWQTYETTKELHPYIASPHANDNPEWWLGRGVYRKKFTLKESAFGKKIFIEFDGVMKNCLAYVNGKLIGEHLGGYGGFYFDLTTWVEYGKENVFTLVVNNEQQDTQSVPPMTAGCWNYYGGIYRNARFVITDKVYIPFQGSYKHEGGIFFTSDSVSEKSAFVRIRTWVRNEYEKPVEAKLITHLIDKNGKEAATFTSSAIIYPQETERFDQSQTILNPLLWSPAEPNLYNVISEVYCNGKKVDTYETVAGIRHFFWDSEKEQLFVNGKYVNIQGFNRHQEYPWLGDAIPYFIHRMDLMDMKYNLNCTAIRPGQYCSGPEVFALADSLGLITFAELPNVKPLEFSPEVQWMQEIEMVRRLRNSPSVLLFDMGDETDRAADSQYAYEESPDHYITCRHCDWKSENRSGGAFISITDKELRLSKMLRCSVRGWYGDDDKPLRPENQQYAGNDEYRHWVALQGKPAGSANDRIDQPNLLVWLYEDHGCDREYKNAPLLHYNPKGWVDSYRVPKYAYYLWQANYASKPMVYVMPHNWRKQHIGKNKTFTVDSNCDEVQLIANGKNMGKKKTGQENLHSVDFENVPVSIGDLKVIGYKNGKPSAEMTVPMTGAPKKLILTTTQKELAAALNSVAIVTADIVDAKGNHIYGARNTVIWNVEGPATLVGAKVYETDFDKDGAMNGSLYIDMPVSNVIRSTGKPGIIRVTATADGIEKSEILIQAIAPVENNTEEHAIIQ